MPSSALQWLSLVGVIWLQCINGTNTDFPAYSSQLKTLLSLSQVQLNNLAFASDAGKIFGWVAGLAAAYLPLWLVLIAGSTLGFIGYGLQYLFLVTGRISSLSYVLVFCLNVVAGNSICWINTVCYVVTIKNFPLDRQVAVGISTSYLGLSAKIYTDVVDGVLSTSPERKAKAYLLLNAIMPLLVCVVAAPLVRSINVKNSRSLKTGFIAIFIITIVTGVYAVISSLGVISHNVIGMAVFLLAPILIPLGCEVREFVGVWWVNVETRVCAFNNVDGENLERGGLKEEDEEMIREMEELGGAKEEVGVKVMLKRLDFWLYFLVYFFGPTLGMVFLNNLGQIAESRGVSKASSLVSLSSSFGFFGRLVPSLLDYFFSRSKYMISRTAFIATLMAPMAGSFFLLLNKTNLSLYTSTAIIGICSGAITSLAVSATSELFGTKSFGINHNVVVANIPIGSFLFGYLAARVYHKEANYADGKCMGLECYSTTFIIWGSLCFIGTFLALVLYFRTRKFYSQKICLTVTK